MFFISGGLRDERQCVHEGEEATERVGGGLEVPGGGVQPYQEGLGHHIGKQEEVCYVVILSHKSTCSNFCHIWRSIFTAGLISEEFRCGLPCELLFADNLAVVTDTEEMQRRWLGWQTGMESKGLKDITGITEAMVSSRRGIKANIKDSQGTSLTQVKKVKYLGVTISEDGGSEEAVRAIVSASWAKRPVRSYQ